MKKRKEAQNLREAGDFVLLLAPAGGFEPLAYRLGVGFTRYLSVAVNRGNP